MPGPSWSAISGSRWVGRVVGTEDRCVTRSIVPGVTSASVHQSTRTPPLLIVDVGFYPSEPKGVMASSQKLGGQQRSVRRRNVSDNANLSRSQLTLNLEKKQPSHLTEFNVIRMGNLVPLIVTSNVARSYFLASKHGNLNYITTAWAGH